MLKTLQWIRDIKLYFLGANKKIKKSFSRKYLVFECYFLALKTIDIPVKRNKKDDK